jgi:peptide/nickel transport system substrate-binding protein
LVPLIFPSARLAIWLLLALVFVAGIGVSGCTSETDVPGITVVPSVMTTPVSTSTTVGQVHNPADSHIRGGTLRIAQASDPASCDLHSASALSYQSVHPCSPMLSQVITVSTSDHSAIKPDLAVTWSVGSDGVTWTFDMREGVTWHDGTSFTVDDAVFSLRRAIDPPAGIAPGRASAIGKYISDPFQVTEQNGRLVVRTDSPAASFLPNLASTYVSIYPRHATDALNPPSMTLFESVVGTGPFRSGEVIRGSRYRLARNDVYYMPDEPYLDAVEFYVMPEPAVRLAALKSHQVDTIAIITDAEAQSLENDFTGRITVFRTPSAGGNTVQMNLHKAPFDDLRVRRAVNLAISRPDADLALGQGYQGVILPPGSQFALPLDLVSQLPGYGDVTANRAEARRLLTEAGFPNGFSTTIHTRANPFFQTLSEFVAGQLAQVGIEVKVIPVEAVAYQELISSGDFEMLGHSHSFALDDPDAILPSHYSCSGVENYPGLCDPQIDELIRLQSLEMNPDLRAEMLWGLEQLIWEQDAKVWFQWSSRRTPVWSNVVGMEPGGSSLYQARNLSRVYIEPGG